MTISMDQEDKSKLVDHVSTFIAVAPGGTRRSLRDFQQLASWINWSLNVFPLLKPGLCTVYEKIAGKSSPHAKLHVSKGVRRDLEWFLEHVVNLSGVHIFDASDWGPDDADAIAYGDASSLGMGYYFPHTSHAFQSALPHDTPKETIFFFEALIVLAAVESVVHLPTTPPALPFLATT
jgi:hypothetical protein